MMVKHRAVKKMKPDSESLAEGYALTHGTGVATTEGLKDAKPLRPNVTELDVLITIVESLNVVIARLNELCDLVKESYAGNPSQHGGAE